MSRVWLTGDAVVDLIPDGQQHYLKCPGGAPANVAVAIARLSGRSAFLVESGTIPLADLCNRHSLTSKWIASTCISTPYIALPLWSLTLMNMESAALPLW